MAIKWSKIPVVTVDMLDELIDDVTMDKAETRIFGHSELSQFNKDKETLLKDYALMQMRSVDGAKSGTDLFNRLHGFNSGYVWTMNAYQTHQI
jgi:hypothetical protein